MTTLEDYNEEGTVFLVTYTEEIEVLEVGRDFMDYRSFNRHRKDKTGCEICGTPFKAEDKLNIAYVKNRPNHIICGDCTDKAETGLEQEINRK